MILVQVQGLHTWAVASSSGPCFRGANSGCPLSTNSSELQAHFLEMEQSRLAYTSNPSAWKEAAFSEGKSGVQGQAQLQNRLEASQLFCQSLRGRVRIATLSSLCSPGANPTVNPCPQASSSQFSLALFLGPGSLPSSKFLSYRVLTRSSSRAWASKEEVLTAAQLWPSAFVSLLFPPPPFPLFP